jgi:phage recombination protein Bet
MSTELAKAEQPTTKAIVDMADRFGVDSRNVMKLLRSTVVRPSRDGAQASDAELVAFIIVANQYGLNPFTREIHGFADPQRGVVPIVGIDGWARIANEHPQFDGCDFDYREDGPNLVSVTCRLHIKGRSHPVVVTEYMSECRRNTKPWDQMPRRMLRHKAFMQACRLAFSLAGIYDEDEARDIAGNPQPAAPAPTIAQAAADTLKAWGETTATERAIDAPAVEPDADLFEGKEVP